MFHVKLLKKEEREERREEEREEKGEGLQKEVCSYAVKNSSKYWHNWITAIS